jgi:hypothetical protein
VPRTVGAMTAVGGGDGGWGGGGGGGGAAAYLTTPEMQQVLETATETLVFKTHRALGPWTPGRTYVYAAQRLSALQAARQLSGLAVAKLL